MHAAQTTTIRSHYDYLDATIDMFGELVFGKPNGFHFCSGMITAHGDKCYSYMKSAKDKHGIPEHRFAMLYLLTYTSEMDRPKPESYDWVISNYAKYLPHLLAAEEAAGISGIYPTAISVSA